MHYNNMEVLVFTRGMSVNFAGILVGKIFEP